MRQHRRRKAHKQAPTWKGPGLAKDRQYNLGSHGGSVLELELIQSHMAQKLVLRGEVGARALRVRSVPREGEAALLDMSNKWKEKEGEGATHEIFLFTGGQRSRLGISEKSRSPYLANPGDETTPSKL